MSTNVMASARGEREACKMRAKYTGSDLAEAFPDLCVATPCGILAPLLIELEHSHGRFAYVHREDNAVAFAAGNAMAGKRSLVVMQNSGFGQSVNVLASLVEPFRLPIGLIISMRGTDGDTTRENHGMGQVTQPVLDRLGLPWRTLSAADYEEPLRWLKRTVVAGGRPAALLVEPSFLGWSPAR